MKIGEFEFSDPRALVDYMMMPQRLCKVEQSVEQILKLLNEKRANGTQDEMTSQRVNDEADER